MVRNGWAMLLVLAACGDDASVAIDAGDPEPLLHIDVEVGEGSVDVHVTEVADPLRCGQRPFADPGECATFGDVIDCDHPPGVARMRVEIGGVVVASGAFADPLRNGLRWAPIGGAARVLYIDGTAGSEIAIPLLDTIAPTPTIDAVTTDGEHVTVTWHAVPAAASALITVRGVLGGAGCHVIDAAPYVQPWRGALDQTAVDVHAYAPPLTLATALGQVHVWSAGTTTWGSALPRAIADPRAATR